MKRAARAIIMKDDQLLLMHRDKYGSQYFTLVGGTVQENEQLEAALVREVKEETGLDVTSMRLVYIEEHPEPYNSQYIYLCEVASYDNIAIGAQSEEGYMNRIGINVHTPTWVNFRSIANIPFRTPTLHHALLKASKEGFPTEPVRL